MAKTNPLLHTEPYINYYLSINNSGSEKNGLLERPHYDNYSKQVSKYDMIL